MSRVRSAKGVIVDFDLLRTKQQIEKREKSQEVEARESYVDIKRRRKNPYRSVADLEADQRKNEEDVRAKIRQSKATAAEDAGEEVEATPTPTATTARKTAKGSVVKRKRPNPTPEPEPPQDDPLEG